MYKYNLIKVYLLNVIPSIFLVQRVILIFDARFKISRFLWQNQKKYQGWLQYLKLMGIDSYLFDLVGYLLCKVNQNIGLLFYHLHETNIQQKKSVGNKTAEH